MNPGTLRPISTGSTPLEAAIPAEQRAQLLCGLVEASTSLALIFRLSDQRIVYLNRTAKKRLNPDGGLDVSLLGLADVSGISVAKLVQSEILPQVLVRGKWSGHCVLRDGWGSEFSVEATFTAPAKLAGAGDSHLCLLATETTGKESVETEFSDRHLLRALLDHAQDSIYFKDTASRFIRMSRFQARKCGLVDPSDAIGKTDFDMFSSEHASAAFDDEQRIIRTGEAIVDMEEKETWLGGRVAWCSTNKHPLLDDSGKVIGTFGISRDITARMLDQIEHHETQRQLQLAQKMESIGRLAAGVAHEVNTPTQFITDNAHFLTDAFGKIQTLVNQYRTLLEAATGRPDLAPVVQATTEVEQSVEIEYLAREVPKCLKESLDGLARVSRIVRALKEFAHPNSPDLTPSNLNQVIETAIMVSRHEWKYVADVVTELDASLPEVPCVVDELNQVILNLLVNAAHAIGDTLKARGIDKGRITIRSRMDATHAVVEVADDGTGITPEVRKRIFEPFFTTKAVGKGTGQGLAIVHTVVVKHHGGTVDLTSEPGKGTTFILRLPLVLPSAAIPDPKN